MVKKKSSRKKATKKSVETIIHEEASRKNIPTAEFQSVMNKDDQNAISVAYERRNKDLDPQLVWRGKDVTDWSDLVVQTPPLFIQEKVHPKVLIDDLLKQTEANEPEPEENQLGLFSDFNGLPDSDAKTEFYQHDANWTNRMILGDSLQVMSSLAEREGLRGQVQCIYLDPPYGIRFNSNFQWSTTNKNVKDGNISHITREPEQVKAFRDTWQDGVHSYLTYLRDRLLVARDLLTSHGSLFVQISDENIHHVREVLDEIFGENNFISQISFRKKTMPFGTNFLEQMSDYILWYGKDKTQTKYHQLYVPKDVKGDQDWVWYLDENNNACRMNPLQHQTHKELPNNAKIFRLKSLEPSGRMDSGMFDFEFEGRTYKHPKNGYGTTLEGLKNLQKQNRLQPKGNLLNYRLFLEDYPVSALTNPWIDTVGADDKKYVVQTNTLVVQRCILMSSDPGDLVLDPTCGSGTTAFVAERWGRRWITIDTSRVALALARSRVMGARHPYYLLLDSYEGQKKEADFLRNDVVEKSFSNNIRYGFVYEKALHITLNSCASDNETSVIFDKFQKLLKPILSNLNGLLGEEWNIWEVPKEASETWPTAATKSHKEFWQLSDEQIIEIDKAIKSKASYEYLYDVPHVDKSRVRVSGPFTVESLSPHRILAVGENDELIDPSKSKQRTDEGTDFAQVILENLKVAGVQQANKEDKIDFSSLSPWPGNFICAEGRYTEGDDATEKRAAIFIGPEFGTVARPDLVSAAKEAGDADFDVLIACAFSYDAHATEFNKLGRIPVLKARMNADLHMSEDLKNTGKGNLFVIFGEPDIELLDTDDNKVQVKIHGVDVFDPSTGEVRSDSADGIACWFVDTDYNEESFFVRHAYFLGANDPYKSLKTTLKAEINEEAWESLYGDTSRPFSKPQSCRIAVKVINHLGDEVMKVFRVE